MSLHSSTDESFSFALIQPLLRLRSMSRFEVAANVPFELSDANIDALAHAWPDLEALEFRFYHDSLQGSGILPKKCPTLRSLASLGRHCGQLREAYIPIRADVDDISWEKWPTPKEGNWTLKQLTIDGGEVLSGECEAVGMALHQLFPRATVDTRNVFDLDTWNKIMQAHLRCSLYADMHDYTM